ncbi:MAG: DNA primase [Gemmatimonadaceae bacterium]
MSSDPVVERVREAADIVQIISEHVKLKRAGGDFRGPCPFHGGKNPNFSVSPKRGQYHCFKCGESGDVFTFLQKQLGMSFPDALRSVAATVGIEVPQQRVERQGPDPLDPFREMNAIAADYFQRELWDSERGNLARSYLQSRSVTRADAERFELGFAPDDIGTFRTHMATMGVDVDRLIEGGLLVRRDENSEPRPRFRNRLMFPILDSSGRHIAFGGRALGDAEPKYLNSPETPVFSKSKTLYALGWCKNDIRKADRVFVVEGYMDAIRLMIAGVNTVVAPLGTALTEQQAGMMVRYTKNVFLLYDSDQAGLKATFRSGDELLRHGCAVRVITLPNGEDPDTFVRANGAPALDQQVSQSIDIFERKIQLLERGGWFAELQKKRRALDRLLPTIRATSDPLLRELYIGRAAEKTGIAKEALVREASLTPRGEPRSASPAEGSSEHVGGGESSSDENFETGSAPPAGEVRHARRSDRRRSYDSGAVAAERELVRAMLNDPSRTAGIAEKVDPERFSDENYRAIFYAMMDLENDFTVERLADRLEPNDVAVINELLDEGEAQIDADKTVSASLAVLAMRDIDARLAEIDRIMNLATIPEQDELTKEKLRLHKEIELLGQPASKSFKFLKRRQPAPTE